MTIARQTYSPIGIEISISNFATEPLVPAEPIELSGYVPFFLGTIANKWISSSSRIYQRRFGLEVCEWRVLASLAALGSATSLEIVNLIGMDAAAVSRAMRTLEKRILVVPIKGRFAGRTKPYTMTPAGVETYNAIRDLALKREATLLQDLTGAERTELLRLLGLLHAR